MRQPEAEVLTFAYDGNRIIAAGHGTYAIISPRGKVRLKALEGLPSEKIDAYAIDPLRPWQHFAWVRGVVIALAVRPPNPPQAAWIDVSWRLHFITPP